MKNFALIGVAGFVAPRHLNAIRETSNILVAALDPSDSVGIMDSYFPDAKFFTEFERFDRHVDKLRRTSNKIDFISITSPNYLHDSHIRFALRSGANAICEKPIVLNPWNIDGLQEIENDTGKRVSTILQLRLHPSIISLRKRVESFNEESKYDVDLTYITSRGQWYLQSWKGDQRKSGGIATNIGVHFFDMLHYVFGNVNKVIVHKHEVTKAAGFLEFDRANVRWFLSVDSSDVPMKELAKGKRTFRAITVNGENFEFSDGFSDLHTISYKEILAGRGFGLEDSRSAIETVATIRNAPVSRAGEMHPFLKSSQ